MKYWIMLVITVTCHIGLVIANEPGDFNEHNWGIAKEKITPLKDYTLFNTSAVSILDKNSLVKLGLVSFEKMLVFSPDKGLSQIRYEQSIIPEQTDVYCNNSLAYIRTNLGPEDHKSIRSNYSSRFIWTSSTKNTVELVCNKQGSIIILVLPKWLELECILHPKDASLKQTESKLSLYVDTWNNRILAFSGQKIADFFNANVKGDIFEFSIPEGKSMPVAIINRHSGQISGKIKSAEGTLVDVIGHCKMSNNEQQFFKKK